MSISKLHFGGMRTIALLLAVVLLFNTVGIQGLAKESNQETTATEVEGDTTESESQSQEVVDSNEVQESEEENKEAVPEDETAESVVDSEGLAETDSATKALVEEETSTQETEPEKITSSVQVAYEAVIEYTYVDYPEVEAGTSQNVVIGMLDQSAQVTGAELIYVNSRQEEQRLALTNSVAGALLFTIDGGALVNGENYTVKALNYNTNTNGVATNYSVIFPSDETFDFSVVSTQEETTVMAMSMDASGSIVEVSGTDTKTVVEDIAEEVVHPQMATLSGMSRMGGGIDPLADGILTVAVIAGHGGTDAGASGNGVVEAVAVQKIKSYCIQEFGTYPQVQVIDVPSTYPGTNTKMGLTDRVIYADNQGAEVILDLHLNASTGSSANGAEVYYPNISGDADISNEGKNIAQSIQDELVALGLTNRGIKIRNATAVNGEIEHYPDGQIADYYTVINEAKRRGMVALIVEHAFVSNATDAAKLKSESFLQSLGVADAKGTADAFGLTKDVIKVDEKTVNVNITEVDDVFGTFKVEISGTGVSPSGVRYVDVPTWTDKDGQDDLKWYRATYNYSKKVYEIVIDKANHNNETGTYIIHTYLQTYLSGEITRANSDTLKTATAKASAPDKDGKQITYVASVDFGSAAIGQIAHVEFATWSDGNGQDDLKWYSDSTSSNGKYSYDIPISNHKTAGNYNVHVYATSKTGKKMMVAATSFTVGEATAKASVASPNASKDGFDIKISGITAPAGVKSISVPVWSKADQSDLVWYPASKNSDGTYTAKALYSNHSFYQGKYNVHVYITMNNGVTSGINGGVFEVKLPDAALSTSPDPKETNYTVMASGLAVYGNVVEVLFPTWSQAGGQDDIKWYSDTTPSNGVYSVNIPISNHKTAGKYDVHVYARLSNGTLVSVGAETFDVRNLSAITEMSNTPNAAGDGFDVTVTGINSPSGVASVSVPVWTKSNQSDIVWYPTTKNSDGTYTAKVKYSNHGFHQGDYQIHTYVTANNGVTTGVSAIKANIKLPSVAISGSLNSTQTSYTVTVSQLAVYGNVAEVLFPTWSQAGGQDDIVWYSDKTVSNGGYSVSMPIANHKTAGKYEVHIYVRLTNGSLVFVGSVDSETFDVSNPTASVNVKDPSSSGDGFDVVVSNVESKSGVASVSVPVWTKSNQSDIVWYPATQNSDGTYTAKVKYKNHGFHQGTYQIHTYVTAGNGVTSGVSAKQASIALPEVSVNGSLNKEETTYSVSASGLALYGDVVEVVFPTWSQTGGQDDIIWYSDKTATNGAYNVSIPISNHKTTGAYATHVYAKLSNGSLIFVKSLAFEVDAFSASIDVINESSVGFEVELSDINAPSGVKSISVPVWTKSNQSDIVWYPATKNNDGSYTAKVQFMNHEYFSGSYNVHIYAEMGNGIYAGVYGKAHNMTATVPNASVEGHLNDSQTTYTAVASGLSGLGDVVEVVFPTWSQVGGQDDIVWYSDKTANNDVYSVSIPISNHRSAGKYDTHVYAKLADGTMKSVGNLSFTVSAPTSKATVINVNDVRDGFDVIITPESVPSGVKNVQVPVWSEKDWQDDVTWYTATPQGDGTYIAHVEFSNHKYQTGIYHIHTYIETGNGISAGAGALTYSISTIQIHGLFPIVGPSQTTVAQMVSYYHAYSPIAYPSASLAPGGAPTIESFCQIIYEEATAEGVKPEVVFTQAMKETGFLRYGGIVNINQFNFAGIGALDGNANGNAASFPDVRTGIRAQVQHLIAYATTSHTLKYPNVDPRFHLVRRGAAPYVQHLGIKENPYGTGWASAVNYGYDIVKMIENLYKR